MATKKPKGHSEVHYWNLKYTVTLNHVVQETDHISAVLQSSEAPRRMIVMRKAYKRPLAGQICDCRERYFSVLEPETSVIPP